MGMKGVQDKRVLIKPPRPELQAMTTQAMDAAHKDLKRAAYKDPNKGLGACPWFHCQVMKSAVKINSEEQLHPINVVFLFNFKSRLWCKKYPVRIPIKYGAAWGYGLTKIMFPKAFLDRGSGLSKTKVGGRWSRNVMTPVETIEIRDRIRIRHRPKNGLLSQKQNQVNIFQVWKRYLLPENEQNKRSEEKQLNIRWDVPEMKEALQKQICLYFK